MKVLFVATVRSHIGQFHMPFIKLLKEMGCTVDAAYHDNSDLKQGLDTSVIDNVFEIPFSRSPYSFSNVMAYNKLKKVIKDGNYDAVHCHTPVGSVLTRLASKDLEKNGLKVIYTAHGFHFYKGAPTLNWKVFYPIEKHLSHYTDCLITINKEDFDISSKDFSAKSTIKVNGVGVDLSDFKPITNEEKNKYRESLGFSKDDYLIIYPADLCERKNHEMLFKALQIVVLDHPNVKVMLPGLVVDEEKADLLLKSYSLNDYVKFMGYRRDINILDGIADLSVSTSRQEGLPINLIEAMAMGNPIICSDVRGNNDLVEDGKNGYLVELNDYRALADRINKMIEDKGLSKEFGKNSLELVKKYSVDSVNQEMKKIYCDLGLL